MVEYMLISSNREDGSESLSTIRTEMHPVLMRLSEGPQPYLKPLNSFSFFYFEYKCEIFIFLVFFFSLYNVLVLPYINISFVIMEY